MHDFDAALIIHAWDNFSGQKVLLKPAVVVLRGQLKELKDFIDAREVPLDMTAKVAKLEHVPEGSPSQFALRTKHVEAIDFG